MRHTRFTQPFICDEQGTTAIEYALIAALIAVVVFASAKLLGREVKLLYRAVDTAVDAAIVVKVKVI